MWNRPPAACISVTGRDADAELWSRICFRIDLRVDSGEAFPLILLRLIRGFACKRNVHMNEKNQNPSSERRDFFRKALAIAIGGITGLFPFLAGLTVIFDPLRRKAESGEFVRVAALGALAEDGSPRKFSVVADRIDAWNKFPQTAIGAVYLRRTGEMSVEALNVVCPHAGCFVDFIAARRGYFCPCHNSTFGLDGRISDKRSPARRAMDSLQVEIRNGSEVWVRFQNFETGKKEKLPVT